MVLVGKLAVHRMAETPHRGTGQLGFGVDRIEDRAAVGRYEHVIDAQSGICHGHVDHFCDGHAVGMAICQPSPPPRADIAT